MSSCAAAVAFGTPDSLAGRIVAEWQPNGHPGYLIGDGLDVDLAAVRPRDPLGNGEPQAAACLLVACAVVATIKPIEDPAEFVGRNAFAGVGAGEFGLVFDDYCARVPRFLPKRPAKALPTGPVRFNWQGLITAEYGSAYLWMSAFLLVTLRNVWLGGETRADSALVRALVGSLGVVTVGYLVARWLKKSGLLRAAPRLAA